MKLTDDDIIQLGTRASGTQAAFHAYLDEVIAASDASPDHDSVHTGVLTYRPTLFSDAFRAQDVTQLTAAMSQGGIMDQVLACLRLLRIPASLIPEDAPKDLMETTQRHLSRLLVDHPVLMHNRIFVKGLHFAGAEYGPIASIIGLTPRAEFPRLAHGVELGKLRAFARHHCVATGLTKVAPAPRKLDKTVMQGLSMLGAFSPNLHMPRPGLLTSILELDEHRAAGTAASRRPASFLSARGATEKQLRTCVANTLLAAFNISPLLPSPEASKPFGGTRYDPSAFLRVLKSSGITDESWFMCSVEASMYRWVSLPAAEVRSAFEGLGKALIELDPRRVRSGPSPVVYVDFRNWLGADEPKAASWHPHTSHDISRWLIRAVLDSSSDRAAAVGLTFKNFPHVGGDKAAGFLEAIDTLAPTAAGGDGESAKLVRSVLADMLGEPAEVWRAALRQHSMLRDIQVAGAGVAPQCAEALGPVSRPAAPAVRRSRAV